MTRQQPRWTTTRIDADAFRRGDTQGRRVLYLGDNQWIDLDSVEAFYGEQVNDVLLEFLKGKFGITR